MLKSSIQSCAACRGFVRGGFSLIELLISIAIIALLVGLTIPALSHCRVLSRQARELSGARQLMIASQMYADDNKGFVLPGYPPRQWVDGPMTVLDAEGNRIRGEEAQRYPWRLAPYLNFDFRGLYQDDKVLVDLKNREGEYARFGITYGYVVSLFPSLGYNEYFVGGSERLGQFDQSFNQTFGRVHVERIEEVRQPTRLIAFASARSDRQPLLPSVGKLQGFFRVEPPYLSERSWQASYDKDPQSAGLNSGFVSLRYGGNAVTGMMDGHAESLNWDQMQDMTRWSNTADSPGWTLRPR